jgi:hypothetical protein
MKRAEKVDELWDFAAAHPDGFTWADIRKECPWAADRSHFFAIVRALRITIGAEDTINLVCEPQGSGELWLYRLVGTYDAARPWSANRLGDIESRLVTISGVSRSLVAATDGRSTDGRKSRLIAKVVDRLIEDLDEVIHGPRLF